MPEIDFDPQHKRVSNETVEFDRLKLKRDERARIVLLEKPTFAYVHTLRKPKLVNGQPVKIEKETRKGDTYIDYDMDFVGRPLCLGDYGIIADTGVDEKNCPACKRSMQSDEIAGPERRFAMNVIRYGMARDGQLIKPFKCDNLVWGFTEGIFNRLIEIANEQGSLIGRDLLLGPCINELFQKYEIQTGAKNLWESSPEVKATVQATYQQNRMEELERACGRKSEVKWMVKDLDAIAEGWRLARGDADPTSAFGGTSALEGGISSLLGRDATPAQEPVNIAGLLDFQTPTAASSSAASGNDANPPGFGDVLGDSPAEPAPSTAVTNPDFDFGNVLEGLK